MPFSFSVLADDPEFEEKMTHMVNVMSTDDAGIFLLSHLNSSAVDYLKDTIDPDVFTDLTGLCKWDEYAEYEPGESEVESESISESESGSDSGSESEDPVTPAQTEAETPAAPPVQSQTQDEFQENDRDVGSGFDDDGVEDPSSLTEDPILMAPAATTSSSSSSSVSEVRNRLTNPEKAKETLLKVGANVAHLSTLLPKVTSVVSQNELEGKNLSSDFLNYAPNSGEHLGDVVALNPDGSFQPDFINYWKSVGASGTYFKNLMRIHLAMYFDCRLKFLLAARNDGGLTAGALLKIKRQAGAEIILEFKTRNLNITTKSLKNVLRVMTLVKKYPGLLYVENVFRLRKTATQALFATTKEEIMAILNNRVCIAQMTEAQMKKIVDNTLDPVNLLYVKARINDFKARVVVTEENEKEKDDE